MSKIVMLIEKVGEELEMRMESQLEDPQGDLEEGLQKQRRDKPSKQGGREPRNREMKEQRLRRGKKSGISASAHDLSHLSGVHQSMILLDKNNVTDTVIFRSLSPFVIDVEFDPSARDPEKAQPRRSPFVGWDTPRTSAEHPDFPGFQVVVGEFNNSKRKQRMPNGTETGAEIDDTRPTDHQFYKATVWSQDLKLDPDWFCDR